MIRASYVAGFSARSNTWVLAFGAHPCTRKPIFSGLGYPLPLLQTRQIPSLLVSTGETPRYPSGTLFPFSF